MHCTGCQWLVSVLTVAFLLTPFLCLKSFFITCLQYFLHKQIVVSVCVSTAFILCIWKNNFETYNYIELVSFVHKEQAPCQLTFTTQGTCRWYGNRYALLYAHLCCGFCDVMRYMYVLWISLATDPTERSQRGTKYIVCTVHSHAICGEKEDGQVYTFKNSWLGKLSFRQFVHPGTC